VWVYAELVSRLVHPMYAHRGSATMPFKMIVAYIHLAFFDPQCTSHSATRLYFQSEGMKRAAASQK
jgi:hypothetical protein